MTNHTPPPDDAWPAPEEPTLVAREHTLVGGPPPGPVPPAGPPPDRRVGAGMLLALGAIALVAIGILIAYLLTHRNDHKAPTTTVMTTSPPTTTVAPKVSMPRFVGLKEADALVRVGQVGLQAKEEFQPAKAPKGTVISQRPQEGAEVARGSKVTLVIDSNPHTTSTPATTTTAPTTTAATTTATTPTTTAASPPQPTTATMPSVVGQTEAQAATALGNAGILASVVFVPGTETLGTVEQQAKPEGTTVPFHSHVQINVSRGPNYNPNSTVPNVVGQTLQQAVSTLNGAHLRLLYLKYPVTSRTQAGKVVQQTPLNGNQAPQNAQVIVYLGAYRAG